jgi:hypothetical protein
MKYKWIAIGLAIVIVIGGSFLGYNYVKGNNDAKLNAESKILTDAVMALQLQLGVASKPENIKKVNPNEIFITAITTSDNVTHILLEISGVWGQWGQFTAKP